MWGDRATDTKKTKTSEPETSSASTPEVIQNQPQPPAQHVSQSDVLSRPKTTSTIGSSVFIQGSLRGDEDVVILGNIKGDIQLRNNSLTIGKGGQVEANILAKSVRVEGIVTGDVFAHQVTVLKTGQAHGNLVSPRVVIEDGAVFKGNIDMDARAVESRMSKAEASGSSESQQAERVKEDRTHHHNNKHSFSHTSTPSEANAE
jgi:cytoskeletal protein CcmA (bactofilin family)